MGYDSRGKRQTVSYVCRSLECSHKWNQEIPANYGRPMCPKCKTVNAMTHCEVMCEATKSDEGLERARKIYNL